MCGGSQSSDRNQIGKPRSPCVKQKSVRPYYACHLQPVINLHDPIPTRNVHRLSTLPHVPGNVHPLRQSMPVGEIDKVDHGVHVVHLPRHFALLRVGPRPARWKRDLGAIVNDGKPNRFGGGDDVEDIRGIGSLEPENLFLVAVTFAEVLNGLNLCRETSIYAL